MHLLEPSFSKVQGPLIRCQLVAWGVIRRGQRNKKKKVALLNYGPLRVTIEGA